MNMNDAREQIAELHAGTESTRAVPVKHNYEFADRVLEIVGPVGEEDARLSHVLDALKGHNDNMLNCRAGSLKQQDGESWAIGELVQRALKAREASAEKPPADEIPSDIAAFEASAAALDREWKLDAPAEPAWTPKVEDRVIHVEYGPGTIKKVETPTQSPESPGQIITVSMDNGYIVAGGLTGFRLELKGDKATGTIEKGDAEAGIRAPTDHVLIRTDELERLNAKIAALVDRLEGAPAVDRAIYIGESEPADHWERLYAEIDAYNEWHKIRLDGIDERARELLEKHKHLEREVERLDISRRSIVRKLADFQERWGPVVTATLDVRWEVNTHPDSTSAIALLRHWAKRLWEGSDLIALYIEGIADALEKEKDRAEQRQREGASTSTGESAQSKD